MIVQRWLALIPLIASCFCPDAVSAQQGQGEPKFHTRGLSHQHAEELRSGVLEAARRVNSASNVQERSRWQEELCKRLIQSEDYVNALQVAHAVYLSEGADPERRAVHHFLMARIYRMMMDSAPDPTAMEDARQLALKTAREVVLKRYPASWGIGAAAEQLQRELSNQTAIAAAEFAASKRSQGGVDARQAEAARAQTAAMEAAIYGRGSGARLPSGYAPAPTAGRASGIPGRSGRPMPEEEDANEQASATAGEPGTGREEILRRLQRGRAGGGGESIPGGVMGPRTTQMNRSGRGEGSSRAVAGNSGDFPDFGASGGRDLGAPTLEAGAAIRGGAGTGSSGSTNVLREEERTLLGAQRMGQTGTAGAMAARGAVDPELSSTRYIPGGVNRPYSVSRAGQSGPPVRMGTPAPATGQQTGTYGGAASATGSSRPSGTRTRSEMIRFNWADTRQGPGASAENPASRFTGPVIIDGRSGRPASARTGSSLTVRQ